MAVKTPSRKERAAAVASGLFAPLPSRDLLAGLGEVVHKKVPITAIEANPKQPRHSVDETSQEFSDLVGSIRQQGLLQPVYLWQLDEDEERYLLVAGERRWRAYRRLAEENPSAFARIPATVTILGGEDTEAQALMLGLIENVVRQDLKDGERASALARLKESTGWTYEQIADRMGMAVSSVIALASIARHEAVREAVDAGVITQKQAIAIGQGIKEPEVAAALVEEVRGLDSTSTREVVRAVRSTDGRVEERIAAGRQAVGVALLPRTPAMAQQPRRVAIVDTPIGGLLGREVTRQELSAAIRATCDQLELWELMRRHRP